MGLTQKLGTIPLAVFTDSSNNVGIGGTANASYKLQVTGATNLTGALTGTSASFSSSVTAAGSIFIGTNFAQLLPITALNSQFLTGSYYDGSNVIATAASGTRTIYNSGGFDFRNFTGATIGSSVTDTSRMTITSGGSLGLGTSSPFNPGGGGQTSFEMSGTNYSTIYLSANSATVRGQIGADNLNAWVEVGARTSHPLLLITNNTERMRINNAGNVGIGVVPQWTLGGFSTLEMNNTGLMYAGSGNMAIVNNGYYNGAWLYKTTNTATLYSTDGGAHQFYNAASGTAGSLLSWTERMRIAASGALLVGTSSDNGFKAQFVGGSSYTMYINQSQGNASYLPLLINHNVTSGTIRLIQFTVGSSVEVGAITTNGSTTTYGTTSDYRLKQDLQDYNALILISNIKTYDFEWKKDKSRSYGVLAHELAEVLPDAVVYEKDGIKEDGSIIPQNVDYSKIVPILVKAIQELNAKVIELENR